MEAPRSYNREPYPHQLLANKNLILLVALNSCIMWNVHRWTKLVKVSFNNDFV